MKQLGKCFSAAKQNLHTNCRTRTMYAPPNNKLRGAQNSEGYRVYCLGWVRLGGGGGGVGLGGEYDRINAGNVPE